MSVDFKDGVNGKMNSFYKYICERGNLDRVISVVQFASMAMIDPAMKAGNPELSAKFKALMELSGGYRRLTRFTQWFVVLPILSPAGMKQYFKEMPSKLIALMRILSTGFFTIFLLGEELNLFGKMKIIDPCYGAKINRFRIVCLFWSNFCRTLMAYLLLKDMKYDEKKSGKDPKVAKDHKKRVLAVWDGVLMTMFAYTLQKGAIPAGPANLPRALKSGSLLELLTCIDPPIYVVPHTPQGLLGLAASVPGFLSSVL